MVRAAAAPQVLIRGQPIGVEVILPTLWATAVDPPTSTIVMVMA